MKKALCPIFAQDRNDSVMCQVWQKKVVFLCTFVTFDVFVQSNHDIAGPEQGGNQNSIFRVLDDLDVGLCTPRGYALQAATDLAEALH